MLERERIFNTNAAKGSMHPICKIKHTQTKQLPQTDKQKEQKNGHNP